MTSEDEFRTRLTHTLRRKAETPPEGLLAGVVAKTLTEQQEVGRRRLGHSVALGMPMLGTAIVVVLAIVWLQSLRSTVSPGDQSDVVQEVNKGDYTLSLHVERNHYRVGESIAAYAVLSYTGPAASIIPWGSSSGIVGFSVSTEGGPSVGPGFRDDCKPAPALIRGNALRIPFRKSGGYTAEDPNVAFFRDYFSTPDLRLPAGTWTIKAETNFEPAGCSGVPTVLSAAVTVSVAP